MTTKAFKYAGVSTLNGKTKIRFANDIMRIKILDKNGHTNVNIKELPEAMQKGDALKHLSQIGFVGDTPEVKAAFDKAAKKYGVDLATPVATAESTPEVEQVA